MTEGEQLPTGADQPGPAVDSDEESAFSFDASLLGTVAALVDRLGAEAGDPADIAEGCHMDAEAKALPDSVQGALTTLFGYELDEAPSDNGRVRLTPESNRDGWWMVRPYSETPEGVPDFWQQLLSVVTAPIALAQLSDLILSTRTDTSAAHAEATIQRYLAAATGATTDSLYAAMAVLRAAEISRRRRMSFEAPIWDTGIALLRKQLEASAPPGAPARLVALLTSPPAAFPLTDAARAELSHLLDLAEERYWHADAADWIADARRRVARTAKERLIATQRQVARYLAAADDAAGMVKMHWASRAAEIAKTHGAAEAYEAAVRVMQSIPRDAMDWHSAEVTTPVPTVAIRTHIRRVAKADGWRQALSGFLATPSPAGSHEQNRKTALDAANGSIRALFSTTIFGSHGLPEQTEADFEDGEVRRVEQLSVGLHGILLNEELREIHRRFGDVGVADLATFMVERYGCDSGLALEFARACDLFWQERYADAARLLLPLIEAGARGLLLRLDEALYRIERGKSPGRFPAMDFYLDKLASLGLDPDWERALRVVLLFPGRNDRNMAAHGFKFSFTASEAAVLLRLAGMFCALPVVEDISETRRQLADPLRGPRRHLRRRIGWIWR